MDKTEVEQNNDKPGMMIDESSEMVFIGLEIGGTNLKAGVIGEDGKCSELKVERLAKDSSARQPKALVASLIALGQNILDEHGITWQGIRRIGVACPGQIKRETGVVVGASNFPTWNNVPLAELVEERTGRPTTVLNDASAAAAAEFANRSSHRNIAVLTLGTGVGLGVVQSGHLMVGTRGLVEGGHMIVEPGPNGRLCPCGQRGCLEVYASATAVVAIYSERMQCHALEGQRSKPPFAAHDVGKEQQYVLSSARSKPTRPERRASYSAVADRIRELENKTSGQGASGSSLNPPSSSPEDVPTSDEIHGVEPEPVAAVSVNGEGNAITSEEVFARARQGDEIAMGVVDETCSYIGIACINICRILDPAAILLTGGLSRAEGLIDKVREAFANRGWRVLPHECEIALASTSGSSSSGVLGAAYAAMSDYVRDVRTQEAGQVSSSATPNEDDRALSEDVAGASGQENDADNSQENAVNSEGVAAHERGSGLTDSTAISREDPDTLAKTSDPSRKQSDDRKMGWLLAGISTGIFIGVGVCYGAGAFRSARGGTVRVAER